MPIRYQFAVVRISQQYTQSIFITFAVAVQDNTINALSPGDYRVKCTLLHCFIIF